MTIELGSNLAQLLGFLGFCGLVGFIVCWFNRR